MSERFRIHKKFEIEEPQKKFEIERVERPRISDDILISKIDPIEEGGVSVESRADLAALVEAPLLEACEQLYDKGIKTVFSSANRKDVVSGRIYIDVSFDSLSQRNKEIALSLGELDTAHGSVPTRVVALSIPVSEDSTVGDVRRAAQAMVARFERQ